MADFLPFPGDDRQQRVRFRRYLWPRDIPDGRPPPRRLRPGGGPGRPAVRHRGRHRPRIHGRVLLRVPLRPEPERSRSKPDRPDDVAAICVVTYALYHLGALRTVFLLVYPMIMFFGVFRLGTRTQLLVGAFIMCAYTSWSDCWRSNRHDSIRRRLSCYGAWSWRRDWCGSRSWADTSMTAPAAARKRVRSPDRDRQPRAGPGRARPREDLRRLRRWPDVRVPGRSRPAQGNQRHRRAPVRRPGAAMRRHDRSR